MHVTVAIIPPDHVLDDVEAAVSRTPAPPGELDRAGRSALMLPVFSLGNVARPEVTAVAEFLRDTLDRSATPPQVRFAGVWALEAEGDPTVGLPLDGEVDRVDELVRTLWDLVTVRGFFVDRRGWAARLTVGSVTATTSLPFLERLVADLATYTSPSWPVSAISLVRQRFDTPGPDGSEVVEEVLTGLD